MADWSFTGGYNRRNKDGDFEEEDVWSVMERDHDDDDDDGVKKTKDPFAWHFGNNNNNNTNTSPQNISKVANGGGNNKMVQQQQSSAPVNVPDWSKIYGNNNGYHDDDDHGFNFNHDDDEDEDGTMVVPPHEWIAKRLARSKISSFSVCEGVGRTLKGRDLSKVRNAILSKTGFLE